MTHRSTRLTLLAPGLGLTLMTLASAPALILALILAASLTLAAPPCAAEPLVPDPPIECEPCAGWAAPHEPFQVFGNTYYVGTAGVSSILVRSDDGLVLIGEVEMTAHRTPGHTPGGTTWTWRSCEQGRCLGVVYADSMSPVSAPGFHFSATETDPGIEAVLRDSLARLAALPCDILLAPHPSFIRLDQKLERLRRSPSDDTGKETAENPFIDPDACRAYAESSAKWLDRRIAEEQSGEK